MKKPPLFLSILALSLLQFTLTGCGKNTPSSPAPATPAPDWNISGPATLNAGAYDYGNVHLYGNGVLYLMGPGGAATGAAVTLNLTGAFVMDAGASVVGYGAGYGPGLGPGTGGVSFANVGGGGHGGAGGTGGLAAGGPANDDSAGPTLMGSGGGSTLNSGAGGALLKITAVSATLNGTILLDGTSAVSGGGAGGALYVQANTIFGGGLLSAAGGGSLTPNTGGGGGGLITLSVHSGYYFTGTVNVAGNSGSSTGTTGANGLFTQTGY